jgi:long-chain acyl-CoA synthetase
MSASDTFPKLLLEAADRRPDAVALRRKRYGIWRVHTWRDFAREVQDVALGLDALGLDEGDHVALLGDNEPAWVIVELAAQALGAVPLGIYADTPAAAVRDLLDFCRARVLFAGDQQQVDKVLEVRSKLPDLHTIVYSDPRGMRDYRQPGLVSVADVAISGRARGAPAAETLTKRVHGMDGATVGMLLTTSGTSGTPKLAMHAHRSLITAARQLDAIDPHPAGEEHVSYLPLAWAGEQISVALSLLTGMTLNFPESPETAMADLREISPTHLFGPPRVWEGIAGRVLFNASDSTRVKRWVFDRCLAVAGRAADLRLARQPVPLGLRMAERLTDLAVFRAVRDKAGLKRVRHAYTGGAALGSDYLRLFGAMGIELKQVYGLTEGGTFFTCHRTGDVRPDTVGPVMEGIDLKIDEGGEILARTPTVMLGYYRNPEATMAALCEGWLRTGDSGHLTDDGHLVVIDRLSDLARLRDGTQFSPLLLENKLKFSPYVGEAVVCGDGGEFLTALVTINAETTGKWAERQRLAFTSYIDLTQKPEVHRLLAAEVSRVNREVPEKLRVRRFLVLPKDLDADDEELTRTRKVRRKSVVQRYRALVDAMTTGTASVESAITFRYEDGSEQILRVPVSIIDVA